MALLIRADLALPAWDAPAATDYAVVVDGRWIVAAGDAAELRDRYPDAEQFAGNGLIMLPAMVDSHDHGRGLGSTPLGVPDDVLEIWLLGLANQVRLDPYLAALYEGLRLLRSGVTLVLHSHNYQDPEHADSEIEATLRGYRDAGIRVAFDLPCVDQNRLTYDPAAFLTGVPEDARPSPRAGLSPPSYFDLCADLVKAHHDPSGRMVTVCVGPSGPQWCSDELMVQTLAFARQRDLRMHVHGLETWYQREYGLRQWGKSVVRHLDDLEMLGPWLTLAHMIWVEPEDLALLAERGVGVAHNPSSNLRLRSGVAPIPELLKAGVRLGIGLDGHGLDDDQDFFRELRLAWTLANRPGAGSQTISVRAIWEMATTGGAAITLGADTPLGRLAPGQLADLMLIDQGSGLDDWSLGLAAAEAGQPSPMLEDILFRSASHRNVRHVMVNGAWAVRDGHSTRVSEQEVVAELRQHVLVQGARSESPLDRLAPLAREFYATQWPAPERGAWL